ncbi:hypothetical protein AHF37_05225 [Paragonimus kellicotti]|nr:hypothetical protein AHF37_05225 [Paragonimus kellicotti]
MSLQYISDAADANYSQYAVQQNSAQKRHRNRNTNAKFFLQ